MDKQLAAAMHVVKAGHLQAQDCVLVQDIPAALARIDALQHALPANALVAVAIKSNPVVPLLRHLVQAGAGLECASMEEVLLARAAGCPPQRIVFDSPAKTRAEIARALELGIIINANQLDELDRLAALGAATSQSRIGLRINPLVQAGKIQETSVATTDAKFGVPIHLHADILAAFARHPWLQGLHVHSGSQGMGLQQLTRSTRMVTDLAADIAAARGAPLQFLDIGGGLPVAYKDDQYEPTAHAYETALRDAVPALYTQNAPKVIVEPGRWIMAHSGFALSRVEYIRETSTGQGVVIHLGADLLLRPVYKPENWQHRFSLLGPAGDIKTGTSVPSKVFGPLCFGGDTVGHDVPLPAAAENDIVVIHDTGGYTLSMWSHHCNRARPAVIGLLPDNNIVELLPRESEARVVSQWGG